MVGQPRTEFPYYGRFYELTAPTASMIACQPIDNTFVALHSTVVNGATTTFLFCSPLSGALMGASATCIFYVFSLLETPPRVNYGLEVYDASGKLCFSSNSRYMLPSQIWSSRNYREGLSAMVGQGGFTFYGKVLSSSFARANYAFVFAGPSGDYATNVTSDGGSQWYYDEDIFSCMLGWRGPNLLIAEELVGGRSFGPVNFPPPSSQYSYTQYYHMLIDVSRLQ